MKYKWLLLLVILVIGGGFALMSKDVSAPIDGPVDEPINEPTDTLPTYDFEYGNAVLEVGKAAKFPHVTVTALEVTEDSRCPQGVQCIWAGTVKVKVNVSKPSGNFAQVVELGKSLTTGTEKVEFISATPYPKEGTSISAGAYRLTFKVTQEQVVAENPGTGGCFVGGCSGQICSDEPGAASTCEYRAEYACYRNVKCERQTTGKCGWTETPAFKMCLNNPPQLQ